MMYVAQRRQEERHAESIKENLELFRARLERSLPKTGCQTCDGAGYLFNTADLRAPLTPCPKCNPQDPVCPVCDNKGMVVLDVPVGHPMFSKPQPCPARCDAVADQTRERYGRMFKYARLPQEYANCTFAEFDNLDPTFRSGKLNARRAAGLFVDAAAIGYFMHAPAVQKEWDTPEHASSYRNSLIFVGPHGLGKTGMAASIVNALLALGLPSLYIRLQDLFAMIQKRYDEDWAAAGDRDAFGSMTAAQVLQELKAAPVLVVDEWFVDGVTGNKREIVEAIARHRTAAELPTIWTTNYSIDALEKAWTTTTISVVRGKSFIIPFEGLPLRPGAMIARGE